MRGVYDGAREGANTMPAALMVGMEVFAEVRRNYYCAVVLCQQEYGD